MKLGERMVQVDDYITSDSIVGERNINYSVQLDDYITSDSDL